MDIDYLAYIVCSILCFIPAIVFHEVSHGYAAFRLGDPTAKSAGRLSLNPLKHIDPFGTVVMPICLMLMNGPVFGYAKPVPYNPSYFKDPRKGDLIVGMAGPAANIVMALIGAAITWALWPFASSSEGYALLQTNDLFYYFYLMFLPMFVLINLYFAFFNILPIPPLDGSSIFAFFCPPRYLPTYYRIQQYALPVFFIIILVLPYLFNVNPISWWLNITAGNIADLIMPYSMG